MKKILSHLVIVFSICKKLTVLFSQQFLIKLSPTHCKMFTVWFVTWLKYYISKNITFLVHLLCGDKYLLSGPVTPFAVFVSTYPTALSSMAITTFLWMHIGVIDITGTGLLICAATYFSFTLRYSHLIPSITMPQSFGTLSPFMLETVPLLHLLGSISKPTS